MELLVYHKDTDQREEKKCVRLRSILITLKTQPGPCLMVIKVARAFIATSLDIQELESIDCV